MIFLILAVLSSLAVGVMVKEFETRGRTTLVILGANYISAGILSWLMMVWNGMPGMSLSSLALGVGGGLLWPVTFLLMMWGIRKFGLALTGSISRLSLCVPVLIALTFLSESLTMMAALGLLATLAAFLLLRPANNGEAASLGLAAAWFFPLLVFCFGLTNFWVHLFNKVGVAGEKFLFMTFVFIFAATLTWGTVLTRRAHVDRSSLGWGLALGIPNFFSTYFLLEALRTPLFAEHSAVAFTLYSVGSLVMTFSAGIILWRERVTALNYLGLVAVATAIFFLNM